MTEQPSPPSDWPDYELIDFGEHAARPGGRRLERFGTLVLDRPCPAATGIAARQPQSWALAAARYRGDRAGHGVWTPPPAEWPAAGGVAVPLGEDCGFTLPLTPTPAGQVGLFPEQHPSWRWIARRVRAAGRPIRLLNLFGYTGGSTLAAAAAAGSHAVEVTHVDASRPTVELARAAAARSGLAGAPIRWIVEDAVRYCQREAKRGARYDAVVLDPPTYGHGPRGEAWRLERDLPRLLALCGELTRDSRAFFLATCHTPGIGPAELAAYLSEGVVGSCATPPATGELTLATRDHRRLHSGVWARWPA